jgi:flagellar hook-associated protein 3 FlgL
MRVTSTTYSSLVVSSSQSAQQQLATIQQEISSGNTVQFASDDPLAYQEASQTQGNLAQLNAYTAAAQVATTATTANNSAMTSLHTLVANASELATGATGTMTTSNLQDIGTEVNALLTQITSIANQTDSSGNFRFGGTANVAPINTTTGTYNTGTNGATTSIDLGKGNSVQTSIVAGSAASGTSGFLYDSSTGVDVLAAIKQTVTDLNAGNATAVQSTDLPALNKALDLVSSYVGSTAASMSAVSTASNSLASQTTAATNTLNQLTQTNLPTATIQLQQIQNQYQASLEAGSRILQLSILNYLPTA